METPVDRPASAGQDRVSAYLDLVAARDLTGARALVMAELLPDGDGLTRLIDRLLVPAMAEVGERWYQGRWNAVQEHVASGVTERALSAASVRARSRRPAADAPTVVVACPRGEGHLLPARFLAELLLEAGADVIVLGPPLPDRDLAAYLAETRPTALVLSCTEPLALPGVRDAIAASHSAQVPVLTGGAGLGPDERRARALGADGWAATAQEAMGALLEWREQPPALAVAEAEDREVSALRRLRDSFVDDVLGMLMQRVDPVGAHGAREREQARSDLKLVISSLSCALLVDDDRLFTAFVAWSRGLLAARGINGGVIDESLAVVNDVLGPGFPASHRLLTTA